MDNPHLPKEFAERIEKLPPEQRARLMDEDPRGLTILQKAALPIVRWLFYGQVGSGRTVLLAHLFIRRAIEFPMDPVYYFDHTVASGFSEFHAKRNMEKVIPQVIQEKYPEYDFYINTQTKTLRMKKRETSNQ